MGIFTHFPIASIDAARPVFMNGGWLGFGLGLGLHSGLLRLPRVLKFQKARNITTNESIA
jgi:hypothetical protein